MPISKTPKAPKKTPKPPAPFTTSDGHAAFEHFVPVVSAFAAADVPVARGKDPSLAQHNVGVGCDVMAPHLDAVASKLPGGVTVTELRELPTLMLALVYARGRVGHAPPSGIEERLAQVSAPRDQTLRYLEVAADRGLVPAGRVEAIRAGTGKLDKARDCVAIAGMFAEYAATLAGKHPFSAAELDLLATHGAWLVAHLKPVGAKDPFERAPEALLVDRFWKEVERRYDALRLAAAHVFGGLGGVDSHMPMLMTRARVKAKAPAAAGPTV